MFSRQFAFLAILLIFTATVGISAERLQAQTNPFEDPAQIRTIEDGTLLFDPQLLEEGDSAEFTPLTTQTDIIDHPMAQWSQWVFESLRNKNDWNIYWSDGTRGQYRQLTKSNSDDIHPHLNKGGNRVVFSSNRDGDYELYSINTDGTNLVQLTHNQADDVYPRLSPNGDLIAFTSYRDGQPEIYLMRSDGTGPQRITYSPAVETMPEWSPAGDKIAFSSNRTGGYRIYTMNINGSNQTQITTQPFSLRPKWSPSGAYIAYDADANQDGWQEVYKINLNTGVSELVEVGFGESELLAEGWTPDGSAIVMTLMTYINYRGDYYLTNAVTRLCRSCSYGLDEIVPNSALDMGANWQSMDAQPPQVSLSSLDDLTLVNTASVSLSASDDASGVRGSDIQYRLDDEAWQPLVLNTLERTHKLYGPAGSTISLRYRSRDNAWNHSEWKEVSPATTFYAYTTTGQVTTNSGTPLEGLALDFTPAPIYQPMTDSTGMFLSYAAEKKASEISFSAEGYGQFKPVRVPVNEPAINFYLPPTDNLIQNGDLEQKSGGVPANWTPSDPSFVQSQNPRLTGSASVLIGDPCPQPCKTDLESETLEDSFDPQYVFTDDESNMLIPSILPRKDGLTPTGVLIRNPEGQFEEIEVIPGWNRSGSAAMAPDGELHLLYQAFDERDTLYSLTFDYPDQWSEPQQIWQESNQLHFHTIRNFQVDANGLERIIRQDNGSGQTNYYLHRQLANGSWAEPLQLSSQIRGKTQMALGQDGTTHVFWGETGIWYQSVSPTGSLSTPKKISGRALLVFATVDHDGGLHVIANNKWPKPSSTPLYLHRPPQGQWQTPQTGLFENTIEDATGYVDEGNTLHIVYRHAYSHLDYMWIGPHGKVSEPETIGSGNNLNLITFDPEGCWFQIIGKSGESDQVSYRTCKTANQSAQHFIQQTVTIPPTMANPVLSFMAQRQHMFDLSGSPLEVTIQAGEERVSYALPLPSKAWTQQVVDLSAWSGQTIEVEIGVRQAAHDPFAQVAIDAISLGSGHPDLASSIFVPQAVQLGETFTVELSAENRSIISADNTQLTLRLPSSIEFVKADVAPDGRGPLRWDLGQLSAETPATIFVTLRVRDGVQANRTVNLTAEVHTDSAEIETFNNQQTQAVFLGHRTFLPNLMGH